MIIFMNRKSTRGIVIAVLLYARGLQVSLMVLKILRKKHTTDVVAKPSSSQKNVVHVIDMYPGCALWHKGINEAFSLKHEYFHLTFAFQTQQSISQVEQISTAPKFVTGVLSKLSSEITFIATFQKTPIVYIEFVFCIKVQQYKDDKLFLSTIDHQGLIIRRSCRQVDKGKLHHLGTTILKHNLIPTIKLLFFTTYSSLF